MKNLKRALSLALSFMLALNVFGVLPAVSAKAETKGSVVYDGAASDSSVYGKYFTLPNGCDVGKTLQIEEGYSSLLDDSSIIWKKYNGNNEHLYATAPTGVSYNSGEAFVKYGCSGNSTLYNLDAGASSSPFDFIFCLKNSVTPKAFSLINRPQKQFQPAYYELYASNSAATLFNESSLIATYDRTSDNLGKTDDEMTDRQINLVEINSVENVTYFAIRMKYPWPVSGHEGSFDFRALRILLLGDENGAVPSYVAQDNSTAYDATDLLNVNEAFQGDHTVYNIQNAYDGNVNTEAGCDWSLFC